MSHPLEGVTRLISVTATSSGAGATSVNLKPADGITWELLWAFGMQDDGAVAYGWYWTDDVVTAESVSTGTAAAAYEKLAFPGFAANAHGNSTAPLTLTFERYATFTFTASAAAKHSYVKAFVKEFRGVATEA